MNGNLLDKLKGNLKLNLSQRFHQYLSDNQLFEFSTQEALAWYESQRQPGLKPARHSDLIYLILKPLILQKVIRRIFIGRYLVINLSLSPLEPRGQLETDPGNLTEEDEEDKEFFQYLESKLKKGGA